MSELITTLEPHPDHAEVMVMQIVEVSDAAHGVEEVIVAVADTGHHDGDVEVIEIIQTHHDNGHDDVEVTVIEITDAHAADGEAHAADGEIHDAYAAHDVQDHPGDPG